MHIDAPVEALSWEFPKVASVFLKEDFKAIII